MTGTISRKRFAGALACMVIGGIGFVVPALVMGALLVVALVGVIVAEHVAAGRRTRRGEPSPLERLNTSDVSVSAARDPQSVS
jgi:hypothetical protein